MNNLKHKTIIGLLWSSADQFGIYFIKFGFSIWIARLLSPSDYGLLGLLAIFIAISKMFAEGGLHMALIQKQNADSDDFSSVFWNNLIIGLFCYMLIFAFSEKISLFFNEPLLNPIAKLASISLIISPFTDIQLVRLSKEINFKKQAKISFVATIFSGISGVVLAVKGYAVWALVWQTLINSFIRGLLLWLSSKWKPKIVYNLKKIKVLYSYGWKIFIQGLFNAIFTNMYYPFVGKYFSTNDLGFYTRGKRFYDLFIQQSTIAYGRVTFPIFSSIQNDKIRFSQTYIKSFRLLILFTIPMVTFLIITTDSIVRFLLTEKWMPATPYIKMFYLMGLYFPLYMLNQNVFNAVGRSDLSLKFELFLKILLFITLIFTYKYGIQAIIGGQLFWGILIYFITTFKIQKLISYSVNDQLLDVFPVLIVSLLLYFLFMHIINHIKHDLISILITFPMGMILYFMIMRILNLNVYKTFKKMFNSYLPERLKFLL